MHIHSIRRMLKESLKKMGADLVGFTSCKEYFPEYTSAIILGVSALRIYKLKRKDVIQALNETMDFLNVRTRQIITEKGYGCWGSLFSQEGFSRTQKLPHRQLAVKAGIGIEGKNFLLVTPEFGPRVVFTTVLTTMPVHPDPPLNFDLCESCNLCVEACPTHALRDYFCEELCIKCYTCVVACPVGRDFAEFQQYDASIWQNL